MRIAVAGGTGVVGRYVVEAVTGTGHDAVVLSRACGVDLRTDTGVARALEGAEVIIDAANPRTMSLAKATSFFTEVTARLQAVGAAQGVSRLVTLSIVGVDRVPSFGYYRAKVAHEAAAQAGPLPVTIVRATQFFEFPAQILGRIHLGPVGAVPVMRVQPIAARSVGRYLTEVAIHPPPEPLVNVAGPGPEDLVDMARRIVARRGARTRVLPLVLPGATGRAMRGGTLLAPPGTTLIGPTFTDWLAGDDVRALEL
ncbi:MAG: SDR family oxidoreductase [Acidimicrobiales bacterium]